MIHTVETFEVTANSEIARTDLSMYGPAEESVALAWSERVRVSCDEARTVARQAMSLGKEFIFLVWLDQE